MRSELRAVWSAWPGGYVDLSGPSGSFTAGSAWPWSQALPILKGALYNTILPCVACAGATWFPGAPIAQHPIVAGRYDGIDQLAALVSAGVASGIKVYPWIVCWQLSAGFLAPNNVAESYRAHGRIALNADGTEQRMLCPSDERNRAELLGTLVHIARNYAVAGAHLDYMRFDDTMGSFTAAARARFEAWSGARVVNWPADVLGPRKEAWQLFNRDVITSFMREARAALKKVKASFKMTAAVFPGVVSGRERAQDWALWVREGLVDWVAPMTYTEDQADWNAQVTDMAVLMVAPCKMYPAINLRVGSPNWWSESGLHIVDPITNKAKLTALRTAGLDGYVAWQWGRGLNLPA